MFEKRVVRVIVRESDGREGSCAVCWEALSVRGRSIGDSWMVLPLADDAGWLQTCLLAVMSLVKT